MAAVEGLFRDTWSVLIGFKKQDFVRLLKAILLMLFCVLLYQCSLFREEAISTYDCKYVKQIDDWMCINKKDPSKPAARI